MWTPLRISRNFSLTTAFTARTARKRNNPGIGHQLTAFEDAPHATEESAEGFDDMESDFSQVHKMHKEHESEYRQQRDKIRQYVVKNKYFPSAKLPNFLTYAEKEQIRILHNRDEEQWSVDVLAESFPANSEIVRKVLKANWKTSSFKRIQSHDKAVLKNWELLKKGELTNQLSKELLEHLKKFINRKNLVEQKDVPTKHESIPTSTKFSSILTVGAKDPKTLKVAIDAPKPEQQRISVHNDEETYLLDKIKDKKHVRLADLRPTKLKTEEEDLTTTAIVNNTTGPVKDLSLSFREKFTANEVVIGEADRKRYEISSVKDRIYIPRKLRREGATYRIDDCYYDDDGEFLYRVPGMTARTNQP